MRDENDGDEDGKDEDEDDDDQEEEAEEVDTDITMIMTIIMKTQEIVNINVLLKVLLDSTAQCIFAINYAKYVFVVHEYLHIPCKLLNY